MRTGALRSLRVELTATFVAVALLPPVLLGTFGLHVTLAQLRSDAEARSQRMALAISGEVSRYLESHLLALRIVELGIENRGRALPGELEHQVETLLKADPAIKTLLVLDASSRVTHIAPFDGDVIGVDLSGQPFIRDARARGEPTWSSVTMSMQTGQPVVALTIPGPRYSVVGYLDLEALERIVERTRVGEVGEAAVFDRTGTVLAHRDRRMVREQANMSDLPLVHAALQGREDTSDYVANGRAFLGSTASVRPSNWVVLASEPLDTALAQAEHLKLLLMAAFGAAVLAAIASGLLSARRIVLPIESLAARARRIEEGDYSPAPPAPRRASFPELDALGRGIDTMAVAVAEREEALGRSERNYRSLVSAPVVGIVRSQLDGTILFANPAFARLVGAPTAESLLGSNAGRFYRDLADRERLVAQLHRSGQAANFEVDFVTLRNEPLVVLLNSALEGSTLTTVSVDITDLKKAARDRERLEQQLFHAQKLEAVGRLAGTVAHDFNNLLTAILSHASLLGSALPPGEAREDLAGIVDSAERAAQLARSLLAYGRKQPLQKRWLDVREVVGSVEPLLRRLTGETVELTVALPETSLGVVADAAQIEQVLFNLCTNARDAMPGGGRVELAACAAEPTEQQAQEAGLPPGGRFVRIDVRDNGEGIPDEVRELIFEPFFTTKGPGKGTGLGLSIVREIVEQHGGRVAVRSRRGGGSTFSVYLPAVEGSPAPALAQVAPLPLRGGRETVLLADDEPNVRRALRATLQRAGYSVVEAVDGEDALRKFEAHRDEVALCLLDVIMPKMNGRQVWEAIVSMKPGTRVLFASGYTADILDSHGVAGPLPAVILKPVAPPELLRRVRETLDAGA